jgi:hypothetical protein
MLFDIRATIRIKKKKKEGFGKPFNPLTYDAGNLLALYDGDTIATDPAGTWGDRSANNYDLTLFNAPTLQVGAINGHDALQFDGVNQYGLSIVFAGIVNPITCYIVFKSITNVGSARVFETRNTFNAIFQNNPPDGQVGLYSGAAINSNPDMILNAYNIITFVLNDPNSELRTNNNVSVTGAVGVANSTQLQLASLAGISNFSNIEVAYITVRTAADSTATQNLFINYLKNRFAI